MMNGMDIVVLYHGIKHVARVGRRMEYEEIRQIKQSEKGTVYLVREKSAKPEQKLFIRKELKGQYPIYLTLKDCRHPYLPEVYEATVTQEKTVVVEEYIEGVSIGEAGLTERKLYRAVRELCTVLEFLHKKEIIHRDVKPSNIIYAKDGHIRLIDFDAARIQKEELEQDTRLLGTRGYAPPEQYGFAQTDARTDIYALGVTWKQLLGDKASKSCCRRIIQKCTNLNPDNRYQSVRQVRNALLFMPYRTGIYAAGGLLLLLGILALWRRGEQSTAVISEENTVTAEAESTATVPEESESLPVLDAPDNPHWEGETGIGVWGNVPESGSGEVSYGYRIYRRDAESDPAPDLQKDEWIMEGGMRGNAGIDEETSTYRDNLTWYLQQDGVYYFAVCARGDQVHYADSEYVLSDGFVYKGEFAEELPRPTGLRWNLYDESSGRACYATWDNLDEYADADSFNVTVYDKDGNYVTNNIWTKADILNWGGRGIKIMSEYLNDPDGAYRFTVQVFTSRPNEYRSSSLPDPIPDEYYSPWYTN